MRVLIILTYIFLATSTINAQNITALYKKSSCKTDECVVDFLNKQAKDSLKINPDFTYSTALHAVKIAKKINYKKGLAYALYNLADLYMNQYKSQESIEMCNLTINLAKQLNDNYLLAKSYNILGIAKSDIGLYKESIIEYNKSLSYSVPLQNDTVISLAYVNLGVTYFYLSDYEKSADFYLKSLKTFENLKDTFKTIIVLNNLSSVYSSKKSNIEAIKTVKRALVLAEKYNNIDLLGDCYNNLFAEYFRMDSLNIAIYYSRKAVELYQKNGNSRYLAISFNNISSIYTQLGNFKTALGYSFKALEEIKKTDLTSEQPFYLHTLASTYFELKDYENASRYAKESLQMAKKFYLSDIELKNYLILSKISYAKGNYKESSDFLITSSLVKDSLDKLEFESSIAEMNTKYETEKKEKEILAKNIEIEKKDKDNQIQRTFLYSLTLGLFLVLILVFVIFRSYRQKKKAHALISEKNIQLEMANEEITSQKEEIEDQRDIVIDQKIRIESIHKDLTDSINYAERIQRSFLVSDNYLAQNLHSHFVLFKPKDVVSGDFYWAKTLSNGNFAFVTADCTGHGVPGSIMSILIITALEKVVEQGICEPAEILNATRSIIIERLKKDGSPEGGKDGMDASLLSFNFAKQSLTYTAANNPVWIIRNSELIELQPDKMPVGKHDKDSISFSQHEISLQSGDLIIALTDGLPDQFGGPAGKKFKYKPLKEMLLINQNLPMPQLKDLLETTFTQWKGNLEQVDDVTVVGVRF